MTMDDNPTHSLTLTDASPSALSDVGETPRPTPTIGQGSASSGGGGGERDAFGVAFDPAKHEHRRKMNGAWALKRGNGARKAAGQSFAVPQVAAPAADAVVPPAAGEVPQAQEFAPGSRVAPSPAAGGAEVDAVLDAEPMLTESDYASTGDTLTRGLFGLAQLTLDGKAWEPTPQEQRAFSSAFARLWFHYQLPRLGPLFELLFLIPPTVAKRADQPRTAKALGWLASLLRRPAPKADRVEPVEQAPAPRQRGEVMNPNPQSRFRVVS